MFANTPVSHPSLRNLNIAIQFCVLTCTGWKMKQMRREEMSTLSRGVIGLHASSQRANLVGTIFFLIWRVSMKLINARASTSTTTHGSNDSWHYHGRIWFWSYNVQAHGTRTVKTTTSAQSETCFARPHASLAWNIGKANAKKDLSW